MPDKKLKVGMVGVGNFGAVRRERMRETGLFEIVAAFDINPEALKAAEAEDAARPVGSYDELLGVESVEAMVISTGGKYHAEQAIAAMERGRHVFVEKPVCSTAEEANEILAARQRAGVVGGCGHHDHTRDATARTIKRYIDEGRLGNVAAFDAMTSHTGGLLMKPGDWRADPEKNPGGMLFQCGVHLIHELRHYFGPVVRVSARMRYDVHSSSTADTALCHLEFAGGVIGCLNAYHVTPYCHRLNIFGTAANLYREDRFFDEGTTLRIQRHDPDHPAAKQSLEDVPIEGPDDETGNLRSFYRAVREGGEPYPSLRDGAQAVQAVFAAETSARTGQVVEVASAS